jgi:EmrB/QacA subfamily drug resistance transporter
VSSADEPASAKEIRAVFIGLMIVLGLGAIDQSIVATALPRIASDFGGVSRLTWIVTSYVLASTGVIPLYGKLSDQYGRKSMLFIAVVTFLVGSALCGAAHSLTQLIIFRAIQGLGAGGLMPLSQTIIADLVPPRERGKRQGAISAVFAVCSVVGPVFGGLITDLLSWHWIFYVNLPIGAVALVVIEKALRRPHRARQQRIDYLGAALLTVAATAFLMILTLGGIQWTWSSPQIGLLCAFTIALGIWFIVHIHHVPEPVLPLDLFRSRLFVLASIVLGFTFMGLLGASIFFPLYCQVVMGVSPAHSGLLTVPLMVGVLISSIVNGRLLLRTGRYKPAQIGGLSLAVTAFAALSWGVATSRDFGFIEPCILGLGLGLGFVMPNMTVAVQNTLSVAHRGVGTATLAFFRSLGGLIGVTGSGAILASQLHLASQASAGSLSELGMRQLAALAPDAQIAAIAVYRHAITLNFVCGMCVVAIALFALLFLPEYPLRTHTGISPAQE